jgi:group II intron reverse transcriptase/maturase
MEPQAGKTPRLSSPDPVSTRLLRIAELARKSPTMKIHSLANHIDVSFLREAFARTRKDGAAGVDGTHAEDYEKELEANLRSLETRLKAGTYRAPPVRRVHIPKGDGSKTRPIGIPTFEDKVLQRAVAMVLEAVYEQDFLDCSYGFRPKRSAHDALAALREGLMAMRGGWIVDVDIKGFFDTLDHHRLNDMLDLRVRDGVVRRVINKWLHAGIQENGALSYPELGTPQGGVVSPLLANVYLHEALDKWFAGEVQPRLKGHSFMIRYADDFVIVCKEEADARRVYDVLPKRLGRFGLTVHPEKTRLVPFVVPHDPSDAKGPGTFDLLGFKHYWGRSRQGFWVVKLKTATSRLTRAIRKIYDWCRDHRHQRLKDQASTLGQKLRGHCQYYGVTGNSYSLSSFRYELVRAWFKWLNRRSQKRSLTWPRFNELLKRLKFPAAQAYRSAYRSQ